MEHSFRTMPMGRLIAKMSIPIIVSMLVQALYNVVDSVFVSRLGIGALNALGLAYPIQMIAIALSAGIGAGVNANVSRYLGENDPESACRVVGNAAMLCVLCTAGMMLFGFFGARAYFTLFTDDAEVIGLGGEYLYIISVISIGQFFAVLGERLMISLGRSGIAMLGHVAGAVFNIVFDPLLIFGLWIFPELGIRGAAYATVGGQILSALIDGVYFFAVNHTLPMKWKHLRPGKELVEIAKPGIPAAMTLIIGSVMSFGMNQILKSSVVGIAVFTVYYKLYGFVNMPILGLVQGVTPIVGYNFGAKIRSRVSDAIRRAVLVGIGIMLAYTLLFQLASPALMKLFDVGISDPGFYALGIRALRIISWIFVPFACAQILCSLFQGMNEGTPTLVFALLHQCVLLLPAAYGLMRLGGVEQVWWAFWIAELGTFVVSLFLYRSCRKKYIDGLPDQND